MLSKPLLQISKVQNSISFKAAKIQFVFQSFVFRVDFYVETSLTPEIFRYAQFLLKNISISAKRIIKSNKLCYTQQVKILN